MAFTKHFTKANLMLENNKMVKRISVSPHHVEKVRLKSGFFAFVINIYRDFYNTNKVYALISLSRLKCQVASNINNM